MIERILQLRRLLETNGEIINTRHISKASHLPRLQATASLDKNEDYYRGATLLGLTCICAVISRYHVGSTSTLSIRENLSAKRKDVCGSEVDA